MINTFSRYDYKIGQKLILYWFPPHVQTESSTLQAKASIQKSLLLVLEN